MIFITLLMLTFQSVNTDSDLIKIQKTLNNYLIGGTENDAERVLSAFDKKATMKFIRDGKFVEVNAYDYFKKGIKAGPKQKRHTRIVSISVDGNVAQAKLHIDYESFRFVDYMNLVKIDDEWKIVGKIFYKEDK